MVNWDVIFFLGLFFIMFGLPVICDVISDYINSGKKK